MASEGYVYVTRRIPEEALQLLRRDVAVRIWDSDEVVPREVLLKEVAGAVGLLCLLTERIDEELLSHAPRLKVVANMAVGYDNLDLSALSRRRIVATNTPGVLTETTADFAFALIMAIARRVVEGDRFVREGRWKTWGPMLLLGRDVHRATIGIIGMGRIGSEVARRGALGFGMQVLYFSRTRKLDLEERFGYRYVDLETLLRESDFVSIHVDLNDSTRKLIDARRLALMKPTAYLINTARGPIVDSRALYEALRDGRIAGAALDVTDPEPLPLDHPLWSFDNVVITPHIASASERTRARMAEMAAENVLAVLAGREPPNPVVSPQASPKRT